MPSSESPPSSSGFTLIEALISLAILSGVVVAVLVSINYHIVAGDRINKTVVASLIARERFEEIVLAGDMKPAKGEYAPPFSGFRWSFNAEDVPRMQLKKLSLITTWGNGEAIVLEGFASSE
ncbi:MAG: prepilin-type N-terminal cleavage/methylation domain-containing protein [Deltaproteobacteria bacterium]|nr:prepilin-type N-terminal cleavage/methylation domain-containing protein [Deltaproteobacteria bacterium]